MCYTETETFNLRSELTSMTDTNSRPGSVMVSISAAFNYSAFPSRRSKDFCYTVHQPHDGENHYVRNLIQWTNIKNFSSSHSEPSWHYWNMNCSYLVNQLVLSLWLKVLKLERAYGCTIVWQMPLKCTL